jgi:TonB family protein
MKKIFFMTMLFFSAVCITAQEKEGIKMQSADEKNFIQVDKAPALVSQLKPVYPKEAKMQDIQGKVFLKLLIDEKGNVAKAKVEKGVNALLDKSALTAAKKAKFSPAMVKDKPVKVWVVLPVSYKLDLEKEQSLSKADKELASKDKKLYSGENKEPGQDDFIAVEKMPDLISAGEPVYPEEAKKNKIEGKIFVKLLVNQEGNAAKAVVIRSDNEIFNQPAIDAAMKSKFTPALNKGEKISVWVVLPYKFKLDN